MPLYDYHTHTKHSPDSDTPMKAELDSAYKKGITEICLTDHLEINFPGEIWVGKEINMDDYLAEIESRREDYPAMTIKQGIEAGVTCAEADMPHLLDVLDTYKDRLDFIIASAHSIQGLGMFDQRLHDKLDYPELCYEYISGLLEGLKTIGLDRFHCVGHVDFPLKAALRMAGSSGQYKYDYVREPLDEIFKMVIENGKCIEFNTSPLHALNGKIPRLEWLERYVELGGEYITIGSDGHVPDKIGAFLREAARAASDCGIKYVATFSRGVPEMHNIRTLI
jgi:histidinol-phosphatase (PHP family)